MAGFRPALINATTRIAGLYQRNCVTVARVPTWPAR
jgi:hypothetical protein